MKEMKNESTPMMINQERSEIIALEIEVVIEVVRKVEKILIVQKNLVTEEVDQDLDQEIEVIKNVIIDLKIHDDK